MGPAVILLAAAVAIAPQEIHGNSCGHDFDFHLVSWLDALHSWQQGIFYPRWAPSANFGAGEARFVFYPPISWMLGAALGAIFPWQFVPMALTFLLLAAAGVATRALAHQRLPDGAATLAGCAAIFCGYALFTAYERSAFGELAGGFCVPLLLLFALRDREASEGVWRRAFDGSTVPLALVVAAAWLSDAPLGVMCSYLLAAVALISAFLWRSWAPVLRATAAVALGLGLAAFYLVPAAWEQHWVDVGQATSSPGDRIESSWLFAHHEDPAMVSHDSVLLKVSFIAVTMIAIAFGGTIVCWLRGKLRGNVRWWIPVALIPVAVLLLQLPVSLPVWNALPKLRFLQFPWRWLVVLQAPMAIFFACAVWTGHRWRRVAVTAACCGVFLYAGHFEIHRFSQDCESDDTVASMSTAYQSGAGFEGDSEYEPFNTDDTLIATGLPAVCLTSSPTAKLGTGGDDTTPVWSADQGSCLAIYSWKDNRPGHRQATVTVDRAGYLILRLTSYPAWQVRVNGRLVRSLPYRNDGLMAVPVTPGKVDLTVDWRTTGDMVIGRWLSVLAVVLLTTLCAVERKAAQPRLS